MLSDAYALLSDYLHEVFLREPLTVGVMVGWFAQIMFTMRFVVQWIASERAGRSIVPLAFWFFSVAGGVLLLVYALWRKDPVFIVGQAAGLFIYLRNLHLIWKTHRRGAPAAPVADQD